MKKILIGTFLAIFLTCTPAAMANTVQLVMGDIADNVGAFQFFFHAPDGEYGYPSLEQTGFPPTTDFQLTTGPGVLYDGDYWDIDTSLDVSTGADLASGIWGYDEIFMVENKLQPGQIVLTMTADATHFGINLADPRNIIYEIVSDNVLDLSLSETWIGDTQIVTIGEVPVPGAFWLLGSALIGLVAVRRK